MYQSQQKNKTNKFKCKICGDKQSVRKIYARSYKSRDLRAVVQKYNMERGHTLEQLAQDQLTQRELRQQERRNEMTIQNEKVNSDIRVEDPKGGNEWDAFVAPDLPQANDEDSDLTTVLPNEYRAENYPRKRKRNTQHQNNNAKDDITDNSEDQRLAKKSKVRHKNTTDYNGPSNVNQNTLNNTTNFNTTKPNDVPVKVNNHQNNYLPSGPKTLQSAVLAPPKLQRKSTFPNLVARTSQGFNTRQELQRNEKQISSLLEVPTTNKSSSWDEFIDDPHSTNAAKMNQTSQIQIKNSSIWADIQVPENTNPSDEADDENLFFYT